MTVQPEVEPAPLPAIDPEQAVAVITGFIGSQLTQAGFERLVVGLSGGVDSATLAALAAEESSEPLRTFSIGFEERSFDELADARLVAERYATRHRELVLRPDAALLLPALAEAFDEPFADSSALPTYLV
jgi:asparagine synthetase B (glutamine-hydrolysing)